MVELGDLTFLGYVAAFLAAVLGCAGALVRASRVADAATRRGLLGVVAGSGGWALFELAFLVAPSRTLKYVAYDLSLVVGLSTVGAWLYFTSAYTGRSFHRNRTYRRLAVGVYVAIVAFKLSNPVHGLYFSMAYTTTPFAHYAVHHGMVHWVVAGLSYALVAVGFFMLFEMFLEADFDARPLGLLAGVTALPVLFDILAIVVPAFIDVNYEPLGVAVFAVGVLYVHEESFFAVQLSDGVDGPVVYLDDDGRIRESNGEARALFEELAAGRGEHFEDVMPAVAGVLDDEQPVVERLVDGESQYYLANETSFSLGQTNIGQMVVFTDVTTTERQRRELERQNEQLEGFAAAIRHELLNTLQIVGGRVDLAGDALQEGDVEQARESLRTTSDTTDRMTDIVDDLSVLARHGKTLGETEPLNFEQTVRTAFEDADADDLSLTLDVEESDDVVADPVRLRELLANAFEFAAHNGASEVTVERGGDWFSVTGDGQPPGDTDPAAFFEYGSAVPDTEAGIILPNVEMLASVHGWEADIDTDYEEGVRVVVSDTEAVRVPAAELD